MADKWFENTENCIDNNEMPLSGDVLQWISAWGAMFGQFGLINMSLIGSSNPVLEKMIGVRYSYGRQLGRMLDVLTPLVEQSAGNAVWQGKERQLRDFRQMVKEIHKLKRRSS